MANYAGSGDFYNDTGAANAYVLGVPSPKRAPTALVNGLRVRFFAANNNTGASTVNVAGFGNTDIKKFAGAVDLEQGDILAGRSYELVYVSSSGDFELVTIENEIVAESVPLFMTVSGFEFNPDITNPTTDISIDTGTFKDTNTANAFTLTSSLIKELDNVWAAGTNAGGRASAVPISANKWYHVFSIAKPDGTVDCGFDDSLSASNLLADATGYTAFRRIGSIKTEQGINLIIPFYNKVSIFSGQREFYWIGNPADSVVTISPPITSGADNNFVALTPIGIEVKASIVGGLDFGFGISPDAKAFLTIKSPLRGAGIFRRVASFKTGNQSEDSGASYADSFEYTNSSSQLVWHLEYAEASVTLLTITLRTNGWIE